MSWCSSTSNSNFINPPNHVTARITCGMPWQNKCSSTIPRRKGQSTSQLINIYYFHFPLSRQLNNPQAHAHALQSAACISTAWPTVLQGYKNMCPSYRNADANAVRLHGVWDNSTTAFQMFSNKYFGIGWIPIANVASETLVVGEIYPSAVCSHHKEAPWLSELGMSINLHRTE